MLNRLCIKGIARFLPPCKVETSQLISEYGLDSRKALASGVDLRYYDQKGSVLAMGLESAKNALKDAGSTVDELDMIVYCSVCAEQKIPCMATLLHQALGARRHDITCFDINSTCIGFLTALDTVNMSIQLGRIKNALIVTSERASGGIDFQDPETSFLFGDASVSVLVGLSEEGESSRIIESHFLTYSEGIKYCTVPDMNTEICKNESKIYKRSEYSFKMQGKPLLKLSKKVLSRFLEQLWEKSGLTLAGIQMVVPHQTSRMGMHLLKKVLKLPEERIIDILASYGNTISASIPLALHHAIDAKKIQRGDHCLLLGSAAGLLIGGVILEY